MEQTTLTDMSVILCLALCFTALMGEHLVGTLDRLVADNRELKRTERAFLSPFDMNKKALVSFLQVAGRQKLSPEQTDKFIGLMNRAEVTEAVQSDIAGWYHQQRSEREDLAKVFPMLSATQLDICWLVIQGYKLRDVCVELQKTESNVTCQRSHIRSRLGLQKDDDLREVLVARWEAYRNSQNTQPDAR